MGNVSCCGCKGNKDLESSQSVLSLPPLEKRTNNLNTHPVYSR